MNNYEAYVYKITVKIIGKIYIGYHKGLFNDSYFNSSEDEQMKKDLSKYDYDIELIATGTKEDMTYLEHKMLKEVDAKNNPMYYNKTNGGSKFLKTDNLDLLYEAVESGEYLKTISYKELKEKERYQVREKELDLSHARDLGEKIEELRGDMSGWTPLLIFEGMADDGDDTLGNGNHTLYGAGRASKNFDISDIKCHVIPKKIWSKYDDLSLETFCASQNPAASKPSLSMPDDYYVNLLIRRKEEKDIDIHSDTNYDLLCDKFNLTRIKATNRMKKATSNFKAKQILPPGHIIISYSKENNSEEYRELKDAVQQGRTDSTWATSFSSGHFKWQDLFQRDFLKLDFDKIKYIKFYIYHNSAEYKQRWDDLSGDNPYQTSIRNGLELLFKDLGSEKEVQYDIEVLSFSKPNPILSKAS